MTEPTYLNFDEMAWPHPADPSEVQWRLANATANLTDQRLAASYVAAFRRLVDADRAERDKLVTAIRRAVRRATASNTIVLSPRQVEMALLLEAGLTYAAIAERLFVAIGTVRSTLLRASQRIGVATVAQLPAEARRRGLLPPLRAVDADPRGTCSACRIVGVRLDSAGRVRPHTRDRLTHDHGKLRCPGSEKPPVTETRNP